VSEQLKICNIAEKYPLIPQWGAFYLFIADFFATQIIGGAQELVVLL